MPRDRPIDHWLAVGIVVAALWGSLPAARAAAVVGRVVAWGDNTLGQTNVPAAAVEAVAVAAGVDHALALKRDGTVVSWGSETSVPPWLDDVVAIAAGDGQSLALRSDGSVVAWGDNARGQTNVPTTLGTATAIAAGYACSFAVTTQGTVVAWGQGATPFSPTEVPAELTNVTEISVGDRAGMALLSDQTVTHWKARFAPSVTVPDGVSNVVAISAGFTHYLALMADGTATGWGVNTRGQATVPNDLTDLMAVAAGNFHSLVLRSNGTVVAWGGSEYGATNVPGALEHVTAIAAGDTFSVALVEVPEGLPEIIEPPRDVAVWAGSNAVFTVGAVSQDPPSYQWFFNDTPLPGTETLSLELSNAQPQSEGEYWVVVSNQFGVVTSTVARLSVYSEHQPELIAEWPEAVGTRTLANLDVVGNLAYVVDRYTGLHILDISNPIFPKEVSNLPFNPGGNTAGVTMCGHLAYVSDASAGVRVIDISDPASPVEVGHASEFGYAVGVQIADPYAYVADFSGSVRVLDIHDSANPTVVSITATAGGADGSLKVNDYLYVPMRQYGLTVLGISDPTNPVPLVTYSNANTDVFSIATRNNRAYLGIFPSSLDILDISHPESPQFVASQPTSSSVRRVKIKDRLLFLAERSNGIRVMDLALPDAPLQVGEAATRGSPNAMDVAGNLLIVAELDGGLAVFRLGQTEPEPPQLTWISPSQTIEEDQRFVLAVNVTGNPPFGHQWQKNGEDIPGATNAFLVFPETTLADAGTYGVTISNEQGTLPSDPVELAVVVSSNRPRLTLSRSDTDLELDCRLRLANGTMRIYGAPTMAELETNATLIHEASIPASRRFQMPLSDWTGNGQRFYRLVEIPAGSGD